jgi:plastocyanin
MRPAALRFVVALPLALGLAACGSTPEEHPPPSASATVSAAPPDGVAGTTLGPAAARVTMTPFTSFSPTAVTVKVGDVVEWTNKDDSDAVITHDVTWDPTNDEPLNSPRHMKKGDTWQVKFSVPGSYHYLCTIHAFTMIGTVTVTS